MAIDLKKYIMEVPDFPKPGISFKDITPLLANPAAFTEAINLMAEWKEAREAQAIVAPEARGFMWGAPLAVKLGIPFIPVRKKGKLPRQTVKAVYELEYGTDELHMHIDAVAKGQKVLIADDVLATGGTAKAIVDMIERTGGRVTGLAFLIELGFLDGRKKLSGQNVLSLVTY
jgi:adenine phosphoribosyltransferase